MARMYWWDVELGGDLIDCVPFTSDCDADYVYASLVNHDGYDPAIVVKAVQYGNR